MKSISITRLKLNWRLSSNSLPISAWNEKHLDYEIETRVDKTNNNRLCDLKWKASRLRDWNPSVFIITNESKRRLWTWNEKHLDYEIET